MILAESRCLWYVKSGNPIVRRCSGMRVLIRSRFARFDVRKAAESRVWASRRTRQRSTMRCRRGLIVLLLPLLELFIGWVPMVEHASAVGRGLGEVAASRHI